MTKFSWFGLLLADSLGVTLLEKNVPSIPVVNSSIAEVGLYVQFLLHSGFWLGLAQIFFSCLQPL